ncbi:hypothetical protein MF406_04800 [Georgenia sp. TF02-10]|uniref:hypothetical protein n=1 Tax=Georgenia sp. TF02-10 TaxID=2917725 RepID=UPI001FA7622E|nr:hypothetical protein [Georgenia sp. TF02-10]UNX55583.1 hypothetical protein MF406_04800 [Georgenia sp. TF02-10]
MLTVFFVGFPLWWLVGLGQLGHLLVAVVLAGYLLKARRVAVPAGFGLWLLFLVVLAVSAVTIWSPIPGLVPAVGGERILTYGFWAAWFLTAMIFLLYLGNVPEAHLPTHRVVDMMAWLFLITVAGGYAGQFLWHVDFPSLLEVVLPASVRDINLLSIMIHPGLAQVQDILGFEAPRPKAPWTYANGWGASYGLLLPFFVLAFTGPRASVARRVAFVPLLLLAIPPVIFTLNRGLWAGLAVMAGYVAIRLALRGRFLVLALLAGLSVAAGVILARTPLAEIILARLDNPHSNQGRTNLAVTAVRTVLEHSPLVGLGTPRALEGNFFSAAGGATESCPQCSPPQLGTQGSFWFLLFTTGLLGAGFFCAFLLRRYASGMRQGTSLGIAMTATGIYLAVVIWVYDIVGSSLVTVMIALALLWRAERAGTGARDGTGGSSRDGRSSAGSIADGDGDRVGDGHPDGGAAGAGIWREPAGVVRAGPR